MHKGLIKSNGNSSIFLTWLYSQGTTFMYLHYSLPLVYYLLPNVWKASYTVRASIFVDVPYWLPYSMDNFIPCVVPCPSQWFYHLGEDIVIARTHIEWVRCMFKNLPLPAAHDKSAVIPCIVIKNDGVLYHQVSLFSPESMRLRSLRQCERTIVWYPA